MTLEQLETMILMGISYDRYSSLSVSTNAEKIEDFATLHRCVTLAREQIKLNVKLPSIEVWDNVTVTAGTGTYNLPTDFDIPIGVYFFYSTGTDWEGWDLVQLYPENIIQKLGKPLSLLEQGDPEYYVIMGQASDVIQITLAPTPDKAGFIGLTYKPVLTNLTTPTAEDVIMKKYPIAVINFAMAYGFYFLRKDQANFDKYFSLGMADCSKADFREKQADSSFRQLPDYLIRTRRMARFTK